MNRTYTLIRLASLACLIALSGLSSLFAQDTKVDVFTHDVFDIPADYYSAYSYTGYSGAKYSWNTAKDSTTFRLRNEKGSGVIIEAPTGVNSVVINFKISKKTTNTSIPVIEAYSKNKPYSSVEDLFESNSNKKGKRISTVNCPSGEIVSMSLSNVNSYIGLRVSDDSKIVIYFDEISFAWGISKVAPGLKFSKDATTAYVDSEFIAPTLTKPDDLAVTYQSSNPSVASVDTQTGKVTLHAVGTTTITASSAETDVYLAEKVSYKLTVAKKSEVSGVELFNEPFDLCNGEGGNDSRWSGMYMNDAERIDSRADAFTNNPGWTFSNIYRAAKCIVIGDRTIGGGRATTPAIAQLNGDVTLTFRAGLWKTQAEKPTLTLSVKGGGTLSKTTINLKEESAQGEFKQFDVTITDATPNTRVTFSTAKKENRVLIDDVKLIGAETMTLCTTTNEGYGTYYAERTFVMPEGLTGYIITHAKANDDEGGTLTLVDQYPANSVVPAGTSLLLKGAPNTEGGQEYTALVQDDLQGVEAEYNLLHGANSVRDEMTYISGLDVKYYILSYEAGTETETTPGKNLGFYWANDDGSAIKYQAPYAFLALDASTGSRNVGFAFDSHPTDITTVPRATSDEPAIIYTLTGLRVKASLGSLAKGIYIVNGRKVLVK